MASLVKSREQAHQSVAALARACQDTHCITRSSVYIAYSHCATFNFIIIITIIIIIPAAEEKKADLEKAVKKQELQGQIICQVHELLELE